MRQQLDELDALLQRIMQLPVAPGAEPEEPQPTPQPPPSRKPAPRLAPPARPPEEPAPSVRAFPVSYSMIDTAPPQPAAELAGPGAAVFNLEPPVPGGRHDLVEDVPSDPVQELARRRMSEEPGEWVPFQSSWQPSAQTWAPLAETWRQAQAPPPAHAPAPAPAPSRPVPTVIPPTPEPAGPSVHTETVYVEEYPAVIPPTPTASPASPAPAPAPAPAHVPATEPAPAHTPVLLWPLLAFNVVFDLFLYPLGPIGGWLRRPAGRGWLAAAGALCLLAAGLLAAAEWTGWSW